MRSITSPTASTSSPSPTGHALLAAGDGHRLHVDRHHGLLPRGAPDAPLEAAAEALAAFGVAGEDAAFGARGPGSFHVALYDALYGLEPETLDRRARIAEL